MFTIYCPRHDADVLLFPDDIRRLVNREDGVEVLWECSCGETGVKRFARTAMSVQVQAA